MLASTVRQILASFIITLSVLMSGTFFGWPSPVAQMLRSKNAPVSMDSSQESWMVTCIEIGNLLLPLPTGYMMDSLGRRTCLMMAAPLALSGWALIRLTRHVWCLYASRILHGCAMAVAYTVSPVYLGEIAGVDIRGSLSMFFQGMNSSGILFVYVVGWMVSYDTLAVIMSAVPILLITLLMFIPESPYYLVMKGDDRAALKSLTWLRSTSKGDTAELEEELQAMATSSSSSSSSPSGGSMFGLFKTSGRALTIVLIMGTCQIFSGISALEAYASTAFEKDESDSTPAVAMSANECAVMLGLMALSSDLLSAMVIDRFGRRPLLLSSCIGCSVSHVAAAYGLYRGRHELLVLATLAGAMFFANTGIMPLVTTIVCEYFPTNNRAQANGITQLVMTVASLVSLKIYQPVADAFGVHMNYALFAFVSAFTAAFVYRFIPETKGKTFKEIEMLFSDKKPSLNKAAATVAVAAAAAATPP